VRKPTKEVFRDLAPMVGMDEAQGVQAATLRVAGAGPRRVLRQVGLHQGQRLLLVTPEYIPHTHSITNAEKLSYQPYDCRTKQLFLLLIKDLNTVQYFINSYQVPVVI